MEEREEDYLSPDEAHTYKLTACLWCRHLALAPSLLFHFRWYIWRERAEGLCQHETEALSEQSHAIFCVWKYHKERPLPMAPFLHVRRQGYISLFCIFTCSKKEMCVQGSVIINLYFHFWESLDIFISMCEMFFSHVLSSEMEMKCFTWMLLMTMTPK